MDMDTDLLCSYPAGALGSAKGLPFMLVHRSAAPSTAAWWASLHFSILHGQALGWGGMPQDPCLCLKWLSRSSCGSCFFPSQGAWWVAGISWHHLCERSASVLLICAAPLSSDPFLPCKGNS